MFSKTTPLHSRKQDRFGLPHHLQTLNICVPWPDSFNSAYHQFAHGGYGNLAGGFPMAGIGGGLPMGGFGGGLPPMGGFGGGLPPTGGFGGGLPPMGGFGGAPMGGFGGAPMGGFGGAPMGGFGGYGAGPAPIHGVPIGFGMTTSY